MDPELIERVWIAHAASAAMVGAPGLWMPCAFFLVASADPCPCGHRGSQWCRCTGEEVGAHRRRQIEATRRFEVLAAPAADADPVRPGEERASSAAVRSRIIEARARQGARLGEGRVNRQMSAAEAADCGLSAGAISALNGAFPYPDQAGLRIRLARLARTVADLAGDGQVEADHAREAISLAPAGSSTASPSSLARSAPSPRS
jgi:magnesium chelatase family protein